ncbi:MAG: ATP-binding protein [Eubacterium sp.]|nr:ATP-binding protein [Eubacterium sp.]
MQENKIDEIILEPDAARIMEGLRDTGYDFNTAMADLVDNSIAANATVVKVYVNLNPDNSVKVYVADNGDGMDAAGLLNAMRYGSNQRPDPRSLGKFGLGLKTASTAFCRSLSLISKVDEGEYNEVCWDLDHVCKVNKWQLLRPEINPDEIELLEDVTNGKSGTLVVWDKVDRLLKTYAQVASLKKAHTRIVNNLNSHFAMVYQRFLDSDYTDNPIKIYVNNEEIKAWDPFCKSEPSCKILADEVKKVQFETGEMSEFKITAYLLPRLGDWSSPEAKKIADIKNDNEGFYIYRENRLIHYGDWLGIFQNDPHISLLRVEFSFDHTLDELFNVDIKKSRITLNEDIYEYLQKHFLPAPRNAANDLYRATAGSGANKKKPQDAHNASNAVIDSKETSLIQSKIDVIDAKSGSVNIENSRGNFVGKIKIVETDQTANNNVVLCQEGTESPLWKPGMQGNKHTAFINTDHAFYGKVYSRIEDSDVIAGIDYLLWAISEAEMTTYSSEVKEQYEDMRYNASRILKKLVDALPDVDMGDE